MRVRIIRDAVVVVIQVGIIRNTIAIRIHLRVEVRIKEIGNAIAVGVVFYGRENLIAQDARDDDMVFHEIRDAVCIGVVRLRRTQFMEPLGQAGHQIGQLGVHNHGPAVSVRIGEEPLQGVPRQSYCSIHP